MKKSTLFQWVLTVAVLAALVLAARHYLSGPAFLRALRSFDPLYALPVVGLSALCVLLQAWRFRLILRPLSDLPTRTVLRAYLAGEGPSLLPGGVTARLALFRQAGVPVGVTAVALLLVGLLDQVFFVGGSLVAALWFPRARGAALVMLGLLALPTLLLSWLPARRVVLRLAVHIGRRFHLEEAWGEVAAARRELLSPRALGTALGITALAFTLRIVALGLCLRGLGWDVPAHTLFAAFLVPNLVGQLSFVPAGLGVTEVAMVGILGRGADIPPPVALAAAALFRVTAVLPGMLLGTAVFFATWRGKREADHRPPRQGGRPSARDYTRTGGTARTNEKGGSSI